jgi:hypothetical protein
VSTPATTSNYSENLDRCVQGLAANATGTDEKDWYLTSEKKTGPGKFNVTYDVEVPTTNASAVTTTFDQYVSSGNMDRDIADKCKEQSVAISSAGESTRSAVGDSVLKGKGAPKAAIIALSVLGVIGILTLLGALAIAGGRRRRRHRQTPQTITTGDEDEDEYSRAAFPTSNEEDDIEAGLGGSTARHIETDGATRYPWSYFDAIHVACCSRQRCRHRSQGW